MLSEASENQNGLPPVIDIRNPNELQDLQRRLAGKRVCLTDVDQTISQTLNAFIHEAAYLGYPICTADIEQYGVSHAIKAVHNITLEQAQAISMSVFGNPSFYIDLEVFWPMFSTLYELRAMNYTVIAITNRAPIEQQASGTTQRWLYENAIPCDGVVFATPEEKVRLLGQLVNVAPGSLFIDDHTPTIHKARLQLPPGHPIEPVLMCREWSQDGMSAEEILSFAKQQMVNV